MFKLHHLKGDTYYIDAPTNIGLYKLNSKDCILIDTCYIGEPTERLLSTLSHYNLNVKSILHTHAHVDHFGSNSYLKSKYSCTIGGPKVEYIYIEKPEFTNLLVFNAAPFAQVKKGYPKGTAVDYIYDEESIHINDVTFSTLSLKGHSQNQMGIITPDDVIFTGDAFLDIDELKKVKMLYNYDVGEAMDCLKDLVNTSYPLYVPSHGVPNSNIANTVQYNIDNLNQNAEMVYNIIKKSPLGLEELMSILITRFKVTQYVTPYLIGQSCITSLLSFLENKGMITTVFENGFMKYTATK